jgi:hypothetical protein
MFGLSPKVSGGSIEGRLIVEPVDESTVNVQLTVTKAKMFNEDVLPELIEADPGTESRIVDKEHVEKPFQVKIVNGKVESVAIAKDEPLWTVNFKRALASKLQLQLDGSSGVFGDAALAGYYADNSVYHIMEVSQRSRPKCSRTGGFGSIKRRFLSPGLQHWRMRDLLPHQPRL